VINKNALFGGKIKYKREKSCSQIHPFAGVYLGSSAYTSSNNTTKPFIDLKQINERNKDEGNSVNVLGYKLLRLCIGY
jgi:hypothetical protein